MASSRESRDKSPKQKSLATIPEIDKLRMSDGKEYKLAPVDVNLLVDFEEELGDSAMDMLQTGRLKYIRYLVYLRLKPNYPDMTVEKTGALIDTKVIKEITKLLGI